MPSLLTPEQLKQYQDEGAVIIRGMFDAEETDLLRRAMENDPLVIQHALMQMWLASETRRLGLGDYERALEGSAQGSETRQTGPLGAILAGHADRVLAETTGGVTPGSMPPKAASIRL